MHTNFKNKNYIYHVFKQTGRDYRALAFILHYLYKIVLRIKITGFV